MKTMKLQEIQDFISKNNNFSECVIESISFKDFATTCQVRLNNIWDSNTGDIRADLEMPNLVCLEFRTVWRTTIFNALTDAMRLNPERLNWGFNEIATTEVKQVDNTSLPGFKSFKFLWESERYIEVIFEELVAYKANLPESGLDRGNLLFGLQGEERAS